jgi:hypothetical protein
MSAGKPFQHARRFTLDTAQRNRGGPVYFVYLEIVYGETVVGQQCSSSAADYWFVEHPRADDLIVAGPGRGSVALCEAGQPYSGVAAPAIASAARMPRSDYFRCRVRGIFRRR